MNPIDNETLKAIGGQKTMEASTAFADTMLRLHQIRKNSELIDLQIATGTQELDEATTTAPDRQKILKAQATREEATAKQESMAADEYTDPKATHLRGKELDYKLRLADQALTLLPQQQKLEASQLSTSLVEVENKKFGQIVQSVAAMKQSQFAAWKANNPELVKELQDNYPEVGSLLGKPLTDENRAKLMEAFTAVQPDYVKQRMLMELENKFRLSELNATAENKKKELKKDISVLPVPATATNMMDIAGLNQETANIAATAVNDMASQVKEGTLPQWLDNTTMMALAMDWGLKSEKGWNDPDKVTVMYNTFKLDMQARRITPYVAKMFNVPESAISGFINTWQAKGVSDEDIISALNTKYGVR